MKTYVATIKHEDGTTAEYRVKAIDKKQAQLRIKEICGELLQVKEK